MRTGRNAAVLAVSLAAHLALLAAWISTRPDLRLPAEPPTMTVQLIAPPPRPERPTPQPPKTAIRPHRLAVPPPAPPDQPPAPTPAPQAAQAPLMLPDGSPWIPPSPGGPRRMERSARLPCKTTQDHSNRPGPPCPVGSAEEAASHYDAEKDAVNADFISGGRDRRAIKKYHELPGTAGFPGLRCTILHRC